MDDISQNKWPEIVFGSSDSATSQAIHRAVKRGELRKVRSGLYTSNLSDDLKTVIRRYQYQIIATLYPGSVISYRSALEGGPTSDGVLFLTYDYTRTIKLPGLILKLVKGHSALPEDMPFFDSLFLASRPRALLENLRSSRASQGINKNLSQAELENYLDKICQVYGDTELNKIKDQAREIAQVLDFELEFNKLSQIISALQGTHSAGVLKQEHSLARSQGKPFDNNRLNLFAQLVLKLQGDAGSNIPAALSNNARQNFAFFEAYFSNYIEGTEFSIEEAKEIVFQNKIMQERPADSHDILSTFQIVSNTQIMQKTPNNSEDLVKLLKTRHATLMNFRPETLPGQFKIRENRAGNTVFVKPDNVIGTLEKGFEFYEKLSAGLPRAIFMMFLIAETHPFTDGNGRIARIMMNAELEAAKQQRIIIPTVYRDDYLSALRKLSRQGEPAAYIRMLIRAQAFSASINYEDYTTAHHQLTTAQAFLEPTEGRLQF